jgi:YfiH family protein
MVTQEGTAGWRLSVPQADALVTDVPGLAVSVRVADCLPLLLADRRGRAVAAVHGGWRSLAAGIVGRTLDGLARRYGVAAEDCLAALGPALGPCCFEVGEEVAAIFAHLTPRAVHRPAGRRPRVDLGAVARLQLQAAGVPAEQIEGLDRCTACHAGEFFSHRRDQGRTGRLVGAVVCGGNFVKVENVFG